MNFNEFLDMCNTDFLYISGYLYVYRRITKLDYEVRHLFATGDKYHVYLQR